MLTCFLLMIDAEEDKEKFELLYDKYRKLLFYVANQILKDSYMAEDAVHHTFIKIIENFDKIEDVHSYKTKSFIVTMVKNCAINLYNRRQRHIMIPLDDIHYSLADDIISHEEMDDLTKAIVQLPVIYQEVLKLKYVQEYSNMEIAQMLDISEATIRKRLEAN